MRMSKRWQEERIRHMVLAVQSLHGRSDTFELLTDMHEAFLQAPAPVVHCYLDIVGYNMHSKIPPLPEETARASASST